MLHLAVHLPHPIRQGQAVREEAKDPIPNERAKTGRWGFRGCAEGRPPSMISQNIADNPRTDAGEEGKPAEEFRKKWMTTRVSDVPSLSGQERSTVVRC